LDAGRTRAVDHVEQAQARLPAELVQVHVDRGDGRSRRGGDDVPVVEADHGDVVGHAHTRLTQAVDDAARDLVTAAEDRVDRRTKAGQMLRRLAAEGLAPGAGQDVAGAAAQTRRRESIAETLAALAHRLEVDGPGDVGDPAAS